MSSIATNTNESPDDTVISPESNEDFAINCDLLREEVLAALRTVYDPELPVNIYDLGLIYRVEVNDAAEAFVDMTLTTPACPEAQSLPKQVEETVAAVRGIQKVTIELVWDPPWDKDRLSEEVKMLLGIY